MSLVLKSLQNRRNYRMMKDFLKKYQTWLFPGAFLMIFIGLGLVWLGLTQTITVIVDGESSSLRTAALTVSGALRAADISTEDSDRVTPSKGRLFWDQAVISVESARDVVIKTPEYEVTIRTAERIPANIIRSAEIPLFPEDQIRINGETVDPGSPIENTGAFMVQYEPAIPVTLITEEGEHTIYSNQPTLGAALEGASIELGPRDWISEDLMTALTIPMAVTIRRAQPVTVTLGEMSVSGLTSATVVGDALSDIGIPLQNLDYSIPPDDTGIPENGQIKVVRVQEELIITTEEVPHQSEYQEDPNTPLDQTSIIQPGQDGIYAIRERIHYENGEEVWRNTEDTWQASEPKTAVVGYGTQIVVQTEVVEGETLEYYRKLTVWTSSYKPCDLAGNCYYGTSSGLPVDKGIIAVSYSWYLLLSGQRLYVPGYGYGVIADVCGGCVGKPWIDLGYSEEGYDPAPNRWVTIYFLTPVPNYVPVPLP